MCAPAARPSPSTRAFCLPGNPAPTRLAIKMVLEKWRREPGFNHGRTQHRTFCYLIRWDSSGVFNVMGVLPGVENMGNDFVEAQSMFYLRKYKRPAAAHFFRVALHHAQIGPDGLSQVGF